MPPNSRTAASSAATTASGSALSAWTASVRTPNALAASVGGLADIGQRDVGTFSRKTLNDGGADPAAPTGDQGTLLLKSKVHCFFPRLVKTRSTQHQDPGHLPGPLQHTVNRAKPVRRHRSGAAPGLVRPSFLGVLAQFVFAAARRVNLIEHVGNSPSTSKR